MATKGKSIDINKLDNYTVNGARIITMHIDESFRRPLRVFIESPNGNRFWTDYSLDGFHRDDKEPDIWDIVEINQPQEIKKRKVVQIAVSEATKQEFDFDALYALCDDGKIFYIRNFFPGGDQWKELDPIPQD